MSSFAIPLSGLEASSDSLNVIANNLANLNTDGFKSQTLNLSFPNCRGFRETATPFRLAGACRWAAR